MLLQLSLVLFAGREPVLERGTFFLYKLLKKRAFPFGLETDCVRLYTSGRFTCITIKGRGNLLSIFCTSDYRMAHRIRVELGGEVAL
jgi:hypothetical protein